MNASPPASSDSRDAVASASSGDAASGAQSQSPALAHLRAHFASEGVDGKQQRDSYKKRRSTFIPSLAAAVKTSVETSELRAATVSLLEKDYASLRAVVKDPTVEPVAQLRAVVVAVRAELDRQRDELPRDLVGSERAGPRLHVLVRGLLSHVLASFLGHNFVPHSKSGREYHIIDMVIDGVRKRKYARAVFEEEEDGSGAVWLMRSIQNQCAFHNRSQMFRAFVVHGLNQRALHKWLKYLLMCQPLMEKYYFSNAQARSHGAIEEFLSTLAVLAVSTMRMQLDINLELADEGIRL